MNNSTNDSRTPAPASAAREYAALFRDVSLSYNGSQVAAAGIDFALEPGDAMSLNGPNGAGKSTILKALLGLIHVVSGEATVLGQPLAAVRDRIGYLPQHADLDANFPVSLQQVVMMGRYRQLGTWRWPGKADRAAVMEALERVSLAHLAKRSFGDLSGGQQQRGLLARALVSNPRLLLLDEPFNGLDTANRVSLLETIRNLRSEGITIVVSTHDLEVATQACSHALLLNRDQIAFGTVAETLTDESIRRAFGEAHNDVASHRDAVMHPHPGREKGGSGNL